jgi:phage shock protein A
MDYHLFMNIVHNRSPSMFKTFVTFFRGSAAAAGEEFADRNALVILDQQIRDAGASLERAKRALALAIAQDRQEAARIAGAEARIADLEARVTAALQAGDEAHAREGAEAIAALETDRDAYRGAKALFEPEIRRLRDYVAQAEQRLAAVQRGRRIARAAESVRVVRRGRIEDEGLHRATLSEAEATLSRLRERQGELQAADEALDDLEAASRPETIAEKLAARGFGPPVKTTANDVLARLRARTTQAAGATGAAT